MIGIDISDIKRFRKIKESDFRLWDKVFSAEEWRYCFEKPAPAQHLAGIFSAKEAVMKALGKSVMKRYDLIEISHKNDGKPTVFVNVKDLNSVEVSISHDALFAVAIAVKV
jgi:holo-[acyl-carrier protein] synthase